MVLLGIAVFLVFAGEASSRVYREARVTKVKENAEQAFYAAEAGFNRVRARMTKQGLHAQIMALNGIEGELTYNDGSGSVVVARYRISVVSVMDDQEYVVTSTGYAGQAPFNTTRVVSGTIRKGTMKVNRDWNVTSVITP